MPFKCPICETEATQQYVHIDEVLVECPKCGKFLFKMNAFFLPHAVGKSLYNDPYYFGNTSDNEYRKQLTILSSYIALHNEFEEESVFPTVDPDYIKMALTSPEVPHTLEEKIDCILKYVHQKTSFFGEYINVLPKVIYSNSYIELGNIIDELKKTEYLKTLEIDDPKQRINGVYCSELYSISLTMKGVNYLREKKIMQKKEKCFVAMWFNPDTEKIWTEVIKPVCEETGYKPIRIDKEQFNDDITSHIIAEIKEAYFSIADLTGFRGGVYYEAGFARGLGREVILCCKDNYSIKVKYDGSNEEKTEEGPHFDVNHLKTILWREDKLDDFKQQLKDRILATIGKGEYQLGANHK